MRKEEFANGEFYHIVNRGVDKREVFLNYGYYNRFLESMYILNDKRSGLMENWRDRKKSNPRARLSEFMDPKSKKPLVEFIAYCLNPNHYHFILRQLENKGIEKFMHKIGTSHTNYFNKKNKRSGSLFQGKFKAVHIDSNEYLLYVSAYVNENNFIHGYKNKNWKFSSLAEYVGKEKIEIKICNTDVILDQFDGSRKQYGNFVKKNALYLKNKKEESKYLLEE